MIIENLTGRFKEINLQTCGCFEIAPYAFLCFTVSSIFKFLRTEVRFSALFDALESLHTECIMFLDRYQFAPLNVFVAVIKVSLFTFVSSPD